MTDTNSDTPLKNESGLSLLQRAILKEARKKLLELTYGLTMLKPHSPEEMEVNAIIEDIEWMLGVREYKQKAEEE